MDGPASGSPPGLDFLAYADADRRRPPTSRLRNRCARPHGCNPTPGPHGHAVIVLQKKGKRGGGGKYPPVYNMFATEIFSKYLFINPKKYLPPRLDPPQKF